MIKRQKVRTFEVKLFCDYCQSEMEYAGQGPMATCPTTYPHRCTNKECSNTHQPEMGGPSYFIHANMDRIYPYYEYEPTWGVEF